MDNLSKYKHRHFFNYHINTGNKLLLIVDIRKHHYSENIHQKLSHMLKNHGIKYKT